ncbi:hypothetical protein CPC735_015390 [Coccidioides posadasii C735 delta SOWgp]|uniref:Uncharacterized protein n=1 Tax=Coccidioides posadasii (strain C735) TaxID=222929 RepID=C5PCY0_COCP7|nr:hypothetical protein CPC735_015390 [Coccidioides posadasii C735 delta SOWgp]EER24941.1 hypothetical protein CPC735_015390 [Coccidioides posadasii C735 delta SOWgp]|eukprot:XP_003067086.1 hypothetical protein CPC735_015390 [Coccidioides posadasii C735 delta SOWgp]
MQRDHPPQGFGTRSSRRNRSSSLSTDYKKIPKTSCLLSPPLVNPQPQYVVSSAVRQVITADHNAATTDRFHNERIEITDAALMLLNGFLDNLLFSILLTAKSTKIIAIRPAVSEVLKPRLAREVVSAADDELGEYIGGSDDEDFPEFCGGQEPSGHFELERSWKLTRLRCMVYSRLGDMEEEDEEDHLRREGLDENGSRPGRFSNHIGHITPAAAIFLTSILEYIGENALLIVAENARNRSSYGTPKSNEDQSVEAQIPRPLILDDVDVEKIALNPTLGRLWRTWRKHSRLPGLSRTLSRESLLRSPRKTSSRQSSVGTLETVDEPQLRPITSHPPVSENAEPIDPTAIPLPLSDNDVDEIEIPGFTAQLAVAIPARAFRPRSLFITHNDINPRATPEPALPKSASVLEYRTHSRSHSLPTTPLKGRAAPPKKAPDLVVIPPKNEEKEEEEEEEEEDNDSETMDENAEHVNITRTRGSSTLDCESRPQRRESVTLNSCLNADDDIGSPVSSLHSDAIGVAIGHSQISEAPSPVSQMDSWISKGSSEYEDYEQQPQQQQPAFTIPSANQPAALHGQQSGREKETPMTLHPTQQLPVDLYSTAPSPIPQKSPLRRYAHEHPTPPAEGDDTIVETAFVSQPSSSVSPPPRLTPLRELVATATSTPDEHSPSLPAVSQSAASSEPMSASSKSDRSTSSQAKRINIKIPVTGNTVHAMTNSPRSVSSARERAGVQRVSPPPSKSPSEPGGMRPRRSESNSSFPERRPITSGSGTSQVSSKLKGLVSRQMTSTSLRSSGDANGDGTSDLDQLIESDETLHYTLTPKTMREIEDPGSPRWASVRTGSVDLRDSGSAKGSPTIGGGSNGLRITASAQSPPRGPAPQPRDARAEVKSVREFANFIKHTGPGPNSMKHTPIVIPSSTRQSNMSHDFTSMASPSPVSSRAQSSMSGYLSRPNRPRLEARPAVAPKDNQTSELIDFIREGPPRDGSHRIPRTVAPFRTTMDSDDFHSLSPTRLDRDTFTHSSIASTQDDSVAARSFNSSFNSRTGLLEAVSQGNNRPVRPQAQLHSVLDSPVDEVREPVRTRRRVRDPYAIDTDSEDEFDEQPRRPQKREESLMDFLRNVPPPPTNDEPPQLLSVNMRAANAMQPVKPRSKSTASTMKSRLMRTTSTDKAPKSKLSRSSLRSQKSFATNPVTTTPADAPALPSLHTTTSSVSSQYSFRQEPYAPNVTTYPAHVDRLRNGYNMGPHPADDMRTPPHYRTGNSGTAALADFLRNTAPPESPQTSRPPTSSAKESGGGLGSFSRVFSRKKKQAI